MIFFILISVTSSNFLTVLYINILFCRVTVGGINWSNRAVYNYGRCVDISAPVKIVWNDFRHCMLQIITLCME